MASSPSPSPVCFVRLAPAPAVVVGGVRRTGRLLLPLPPPLLPLPLPLRLWAGKAAVVAAEAAAVGVVAGMGGGSSSSGAIWKAGLLCVWVA